MRILATSILAVACAAGAIAQEGIKPEKVAEIKLSSVFIRNQSGTQKSSGSGFVVSSTADTLLIATNAHVVAPDDMNTKVPSQILTQVNKATITTVFESGTPNERGAKAEVVSFDPVADIAILKVKAADVKDPPKALKIEGAKPLAETTTVYTFGFPFGDKLSTGKGPAITVGKASVSSLRTDDLGKLTTIQIDGNLNPGNSGGPVLDVEGTVIGVATATIRDSQGIGLIVPVAEVNAMLGGKVVLINADYQKQTDGKLKVVFEAFLSNPAGKVAGATLSYVVAEPNAEKPQADAALHSLPGAKSLALKLDGSVAKGELLLDKAEGQLFFCAKAVGGTADASANVYVSLSRAAQGKQGLDPDAKPPAGWKEIAMSDGFITAWVPEKSGKQLDRTKDLRGPNLTMRIVSTVTVGDNGVLYHLERANISITGAGASSKRIDTKVLRELLIKSIAEDVKGKVTSETDAKMGTWACKEYAIKAGSETSVVRILVTGVTLYIAHVHGPSRKVEGDDGDIFLNSFRTHKRERPEVAIAPKPTPPTIPTPPSVRPSPNVPAPPIVGSKPPMPPSVPSPPNRTPGNGTTILPPNPKPIPSPFDKVPGAKVLDIGETEIVGGHNNPISRDYATDGGILVGFEIGVGTRFNRSEIAAIRTLYKAGDKESNGEGFGDLAAAKTVKAKDGYAVGAVLVQRGISLEGMSVVFMKLENGRLDPKDFYESEWFGLTPKRNDMKLFGNGLPFMGVSLKVDARSKQVTGIGLILNSAEALAAKRSHGFGVATEIPGISFDALFRDVAPEGALLVGLEIGLAKDGNNMAVRALKPIYRSGTTETFGLQYGTKLATTVVVKAKPGYAVAGASVKVGLAVDGVLLQFMKVAGDKLDPTDSYESDWVGVTGAAGAKKLAGDGTAAVGLTGRTNGFKMTSAFGLLMLKPGDTLAVTSPPGTGTTVTTPSAGTAGVPSEIIGGARDPVYRDTAPEGGYLVGLEIGTNAQTLIKGIKPIYLTGNRESTGDQHGTVFAKTTTIKAKEGYAIGAVTVISGLRADGISVTFMKIEKTGLNPKISYESEWVGFTDQRKPRTLSGMGTPVIGITGKQTARENTGFGLILQSDAKK